MHTPLVAAQVVLLVSASLASTEEKVRIEHSRGFHTAGAAEHFPEYWASLKDRHKMEGAVADHLTAEKIESVVMLEVGIAVAFGPQGTGMQDELLRFTTNGNRFETGPLPEGFAKNPRKHLVALFRTRNGDHGLITVYRDIAVVELNGKVGVAPAIPKVADGRR